MAIAVVVLGVRIDVKRENPWYEYLSLVQGDETQQMCTGRRFITQYMYVWKH